MTGYIFRITLSDFLRPGRIFLWAMIGVAVFAMGKVWLNLGHNLPQAEAYGQLASILVYRLMALASAIFTTMVISQEIEQKTITYWLTRPIPRWRILLGRWLASVTAVIGVSWIAEAGAAASVLGFSFLGNAAFHRDLIVLAVGALAYGALFLFISLLLNRAMIYCLLFAFGWETFVPNMMGDLFYLSISTYLNALATHPEPSGGPGLLVALAGDMAARHVPMSTAWLILTFVTAGFAGLSAWWFTRFEFSPREDAE